MVDILQFYKETTERPPEDQILEKFPHAAPADSRPYNTPTSPNMYPTNYMGKTCPLSTVDYHVGVTDRYREQEVLRTPEPLRPCHPRELQVET